MVQVILDDPAIRARALGRPWCSDPLRQSANLRFDIDGTEFAMRGEVRNRDRADTSRVESGGGQHREDPRHRLGGRSVDAANVGERVR